MCKSLCLKAYISDDLKENNIIFNGKVLWLASCRCAERRAKLEIPGARNERSPRGDLDSFKWSITNGMFCGIRFCGMYFFAERWCVTWVSWKSRSHYFFLASASNGRLLNSRVPVGKCAAAFFLSPWSNIVCQNRDAGVMHLWNRQQGTITILHIRS